MRRPIPSAFHGLIDYPTGLLLIVSPWLFGFGFFRDDAVAASAVPFFLGLLILGTSLVTDYEFSLLNLVPLPVHLALDVIGGVFLAISPWLFGFVQTSITSGQYPADTWIFHPIVGIALIAAGLLTQPQRAATDSETLATVDPGPLDVPDATRPRNGRFGHDGADEATGVRRPGAEERAAKRRDEDAPR